MKVTLFVVVFGDGLTNGTGVRAEETYPEHLSRMLGRELINSGADGNTTGAGYKIVAKRICARLKEHYPSTGQ